jgi:hypothetical protein
MTPEEIATATAHLSQRATALYHETAVILETVRVTGRVNLVQAAVLASWDHQWEQMSVFDIADLPVERDP